MTDGIKYPLYVFAMDCGEVMEFSSLQLMQRQLEPIDVENGEYEAWDAEGRLLKLSIGESRQDWLLLKSTGEMKNEQDFAAVRAKAKRRER